MTPLLAMDLPAIVLILGVLVLCATTAVTALGLPAFDRKLGRRRTSEPKRPAETPMYPPVMARRVITGRPASLADATPPRAMAAIELPSASTSTGLARVATPSAAGQARRVVDRPLTSAGAAEAYIAELVDDDPERMASLMMQWINTESTTSVTPSDSST